jgi:hypothetical protein
LARLSTRPESQLDMESAKFKPPLPMLD